MIALADALRTARSQAIADALVNGGALTVYDGSRPASGAAVTTQAALVVLVISAPAGTVDDGALTFAPIDEAMATASGTATWARITDDAGAYVMDLDVTVPDEGGDVELTTVAVVAGGLIEVTAAVIQEP